MVLSLTFFHHLLVPLQGCVLSPLLFFCYTQTNARDDDYDDSFSVSTRQKLPGLWSGVQVFIARCEWSYINVKKPKGNDNVLLQEALACSPFLHPWPGCPGGTTIQISRDSAGWQTVS